ncbi:MAG TPA: hypothetical protein VFL80_12260 [Thermoanaerobaculia bacterium]|nr:hypothetical protein [Thermoanaerobaculia bacterium]
MNRTTRIAAVALLLAILLPQAASACPVCFGDPNAPIQKGLNNGIIVLLVIIGIVQVGFVALFITLWKRSKLSEAKRSQFRLIEGGFR